jgi:DNA-binding transcriptional LysR family regulator
VSTPETTVHGIELRHLRYFVAVADAGTFTRAASQMFVAQPTLSQQVRKLEDMVGAPLLQRRREGVRLTAAGAALLEESRSLLAQIDDGVRRARHAAGLDRPRIRIVLPPDLPETLAVLTASSLRCAVLAADVRIEWLESPLDAEFSLIRNHRADAGVGWVPSGQDTLADPLDAMRLGEFEPRIWVKASSEAAHCGAISLTELAAMDVIHGPQRGISYIYDAWLAALRSEDPRFDFVDPTFRHSLPVTLAFASTASRPTAVLSGPSRSKDGAVGPDVPSVTYDMVPVRLQGRPLTATAVLAWNAALPRRLQQILYETADAVILAGDAAGASLELADIA